MINSKEKEAFSIKSLSLGVYLSLNPALEGTVPKVSGLFLIAGLLMVRKLSPKVTGILLEKT